MPSRASARAWFVLKTKSEPWFTSVKGRRALPQPKKDQLQPVRLEPTSPLQHHPMPQPFRPPDTCFLHMGLLWHGTQCAFANTLCSRMFVRCCLVYKPLGHPPALRFVRSSREPQLLNIENNMFFLIVSQSLIRSCVRGLDVKESFGVTSKSAKDRVVSATSIHDQLSPITVATK